MMKPNANEIPSRSAPVIAGTALPANTRVATTDPGPPSQSSAVPSVSATARCERWYFSSTAPPVAPEGTHCSLLLMEGQDLGPSCRFEGASGPTDPPLPLQSIPIR